MIFFDFQPLDSESTIYTQEPESPSPILPCKITVKAPSDDDDDDEDEYGNKKPKKPQYQ